MPTKLPGVGYVPNPAISRAGGRAYAMRLTADPFAVSPGLSQQEEMARRYGPYWTQGVAGPHTPDYWAYMTDDFRERRARWITNPADYDRYDGNPTVKEFTDAYYSGGVLVLPRPQVTPAPVDPPEPPSPPVPVDPPPPPATGLTAVPARVEELLGQTFRVAVEYNRAGFYAGFNELIFRTKLLHDGFAALIRLKRRLLGEA